MRGILNRTVKKSRPERPHAPLKTGMDTRGVGYARLENMYIDYEVGGNALTSIPGFRRIYKAIDRVHSLFFVGLSEDRGFMLIHSGEKLYRLPICDRDKNPRPSVIAHLCDRESTSLSFGSVAFITDGVRLIMINHLGEPRLISEDREIAGCRCGAVYDGRLFLSGNKETPGRVYYSTPLNMGEPLFRSEGSFTEGSGKVNITSLTSLNGYLWLFKESADGEGDIICRQAVGGECYPTVRVIDGVRPISGVMTQGGELVFLTHRGLVSLNASAEGDVEITDRSLPINKMLLKERLGEAEFGRWMGYTVIAFGERVYLADPTGNGGWNWFPISRVGGYKGSRRVYRYSECAEEGCQTNPRTNEAATGEIYSRGKRDGGLIYYSMEGDKRYSVYPTAQFSGGEFMPLKKLYANGRLMWFATENGGIYLFNNDKRGASPKEIPFSESSDYAINPLCEGSGIHPIFYLFDSHAPSYIATTYPNEGGDKKPRKEKHDEQN